MPVRQGQGRWCRPSGLANVKVSLSDASPSLHHTSRITPHQATSRQDVASGGSSHTCDSASRYSHSVEAARSPDAPPSRPPTTEASQPLAARVMWPAPAADGGPATAAEPAALMDCPSAAAAKPPRTGAPASPPPAPTATEHCVTSGTPPPPRALRALCTGACASAPLPSSSSAATAAPVGLTWMTSVAERGGTSRPPSACGAGAVRAAVHSKKRLSYATCKALLFERRAS